MTISCPKCGAENQAESAHCALCHHPFKEETDRPKSVKTTSDRPIVQRDVLAYQPTQNTPLDKSEPPSVDINAPEGEGDTQAFPGLESSNKTTTSDRPIIKLVDGVNRERKTGVQEGEKFGDRYAIERMLGKGGMGVVYHAHDMALDESCALKLLQPQFTANPEELERFKREIKTARRITHPNVIRIHDYGVVADEAYISMELLTGGDLKDRLDQGAISIAEGVQIIRGIAAGLQAAHDQGVIHRDIKPQNVLFDECQVPKLMDFGIARLSDTTSHTVGFVGTPYYMSPEQVNGKTAEFRSDIYSLGVVMFQVFTGQLPFHSETLVGIAVKHAREKPPRPSDINPNITPGLERIILKALEKRPSDRFESAEALIAAIDRLEQGEPAALPLALAGGQAANEGSGPTDTLQNSWGEMAPEPNRRGLKIAAVFAVVASLAAAAFFIFRDYVIKPKPGPLVRRTVRRLPVVPVTRPVVKAVPRPTLTQPVALPVVRPLTTMAEVFGWLLLKTRPSKAGIYLGKKKIGVSGKKVHKLPAGVHKFRIELKHHETVTKTWRIPEGKRVIKKLKLKKKKKPVETVVKPVETVKKPVETVVKPVETVVKPVETVIKPVPVAEKLKPLLEKAENYFRKHSYKKAKQALNEAARLSPDHAKVKAQLARLKIYTRHGGMVYVPAGPFIMGSNRGDADERPSRSETLGSYYIDQYEVSNGAYKRFVSRKKVSPPPDWKGGTYPKGARWHPVSGVSWKDSRNFCRWMGKDLPTESQWEKAARGVKGNRWPWGNSGGGSSNIGRKKSGKSSVFSFWGGRSPFGAVNMAGNVWEWTRTRDPKGRLAAGRYLIKGGAYNSPVRWGRGANRGRATGLNFNTIGFRCVSKAN